MPVRHFYLLPHYISYGLFFLFSACWLHVNEFNSIWEGIRGRDQKISACSEGISVREFYLPALTLYSCDGLSTMLTFINACHTLHDAHLAARMLRRSWIRMYDKYKGDFFTFLENDNPLYFYCSLKRVPNLLDDIPFEQVRDFWPCHLFPPKDSYFHSFWSQNTETEKDSA